MKGEALRYLKAGFSIIPVGSNKKPLVPWKDYQRRKPSPGEVKNWWREHPDALIGLITGEFNNLTVLDCDSQDALEAVKRLLPEGYAVISSTTQRRTGTHLFFGFTPGLGSKNCVREHLDVKSEGGFVIVPPSKGQKGLYSWNDGSDIRTCASRPLVPPELIRFLKNGTEQGHGRSSSATQPPLEVLPGDTLEPIAEGFRDDKLFHMALQLIRAGEPYESVEQYVVTAAKGCSPTFSAKVAVEKVASAFRWHQENGMQNRNTQRESAQVERLACRDASAVQERAIQWLWQGVFPTHMATSLTGDPGMGKTLVAVDLAARVSIGAEFPVYDRPSPTVQGRVLYVTSEGVLEMILVPRLRVAGADLTNIRIIEGTYLKDGELSILDITRDLPRLEQEARAFGNVKLLVVDPVASVLPDSINPNQQNHVRRAMDRISNLAYSLGIAAVIVMHWAKDTTLRGANRTAGSVQFGAAMKMSWGVVQSEDEPKNFRLLVPQKSNISGNHQSLRFSIHGVGYGSLGTRETIETSKIEYEGLVDDDPETLLSPPIENESRVTQACDFLRRKLREGTILYSVPLMEEAEREGIPRWALYKAKKRLGVEDDKEGTFQGRTYWFKRSR